MVKHALDAWTVLAGARNRPRLLCPTCKHTVKRELLRLRAHGPSRGDSTLVDSWTSARSCAASLLRSLRTGDERLRRLHPSAAAELQEESGRDASKKAASLVDDGLERESDRQRGQAVDALRASALPPAPALSSSCRCVHPGPGLRAGSHRPRGRPAWQQLTWRRARAKTAARVEQQSNVHVRLKTTRRKPTRAEKHLRSERRATEAAAEATRASGLKTLSRARPTRPLGRDKEVDR